MFHHDLPFDPTYGYDLDALLQVPAPAPPADFAAFWRSQYQQALAIPPRTTRREIACSHADLRLEEVEFDSWAGVRIGGWLVTPRSGNITRGYVVGHGYGGREQPDWAGWPGDTAVLFPCARGFHRSAHAGIPNSAAFHVLHGLEQRETYVHLGCCADFLWCAINALRELTPTVGAELYYHGTSFGGGIGALAAPWELRVRRISLEVPSFGNHPLRVTIPCTGSGEAVRKLYTRKPEVLNVLAYYDAATAATFQQAPALCACALFDPAVPPPGQFAVYNAMPGAKELFVRQAGHFSYPTEVEEGQRLGEVRQQFLFGA